MRHARVVMAICLTLAVATIGPARAVEVRDVSEVLAGPIIVTPDPSGRSAILEVRTTVDLACSVVYGTDASFGRIAVDSDMGGGAHADHRPVMSGLEPDTEYVYRVQGTAADGTLYVSEVMSFRTPAAPMDRPHDLALAATVSRVSSELSAAFAAANAIDGDPATAWSSAGDGDDAWIEIDLGSTAAVGSVDFRTRSMSDGSAITETYTLTADGTEIGTFSADEPVALDTEARLLRFDVATSTGGNTGALEILILAAEDEVR
jgi:hypothetical protein